MSTLPAGSRRTIALIVILAATFMQLLDISIVGVAAADIQQNLASGAGGIALVLVGYQIGFAATLITAARLGDMYGRRRLFLTGMVTFTIASMLCGLAPSIGVLVAARVGQGIASGLMFPQVLTVIQVMYPPAERGSALGAYGTTIGLGTILGPVIGGALIQFRIFPRRLARDLLRQRPHRHRRDHRRSAPRTRVHRSRPATTRPGRRSPVRRRARSAALPPRRGPVRGLAARRCRDADRRGGRTGRVRAAAARPHPP